MIASCIAMALALTLDGASLYLLGQARSAEAAPAAFVGLHGAACIVAALAVRGLLPPVYRTLPRAGLLFVLALTLAIPVLGMLGIALALVPALWRQHGQARDLDCLQASAMDTIAPGTPETMCAPAVGDAYLMGILQCAPERSRRLQALMATLSLDAQQAAPLLQIGLKDRDDDVRLLAYSLLTRKEKVLEDRIGKSLRRLDLESASGAFVLHRSLARDYWELAGLGNAASSNAFLLERSGAHARAGTALQPGEASLQLLLGRILLKQNDLEAARAALLRATAAGIAVDTVAPFLAEIAFRRRQFSEITTLLKMGGRSALPFPLNQMAAYWETSQDAR